MQETQQNSAQEDDRLKGWKEIAQCLHSSERTVQRWEHILRLPVHRIGTPGNAIVLASRRELEIWVKSIEGRRAVSEQAGAEPMLEPDANSTSDEAGVFGQESPTPTISPEALATRGAIASPAGNRRPLWRGFLWAALALGAVALLVRFVPLADSLGWRAAISENAVATPAASEKKASMLVVRLTIDDGTVAAVGIPSGGTATCTAGVHGSYVLSADVTAEGARVHVSRLDAGNAQTSPRLEDLAALTLRRGERVALDRIPGIVAIELTSVNALAKRPAAASR